MKNTLLTSLWFRSPGSLDNTHARLTYSPRPAPSLCITEPSTYDYVCSTAQSRTQTPPLVVSPSTGGITIVDIDRDQHNNITWKAVGIVPQVPRTRRGHAGSRSTSSPPPPRPHPHVLRTQTLESAPAGQPHWDRDPSLPSRRAETTPRRFYRAKRSTPWPTGSMLRPVRPAWCYWTVPG